MLVINETPEDAAETRRVCMQALHDLAEGK
jgi:hypothetical protein